jgi:branched-chain amino acid transport system ATP-binding protein
MISSPEISMLAPKILLVDEPSVGLSPLLVSRTIDTIQELKSKYQLTVLMAEQNFNQAIRIADSGYVIVHGKIAYEGKSAHDLHNNDLIRKLYLGICTLPPSS